MNVKVVVYISFHCIFKSYDSVRRRWKDAHLKRRLQYLKHKECFINLLLAPVSLHSK
jgi:hypothetical protein